MRREVIACRPDQRPGGCPSGSGPLSQARVPGLHDGLCPVGDLQLGQDPGTPGADPVRALDRPGVHHGCTVPVRAVRPSCTQTHQGVLALIGPCRLLERVAPDPGTRGEAKRRIDCVTAETLFAPGVAKIVDELIVVLTVTATTIPLSF
jgi:hypothetical protein